MLTTHKEGERAVTTRPDTPTSVGVRISSSSNSANGLWCNTYNAEGQRVRKTNVTQGTCAAPTQTSAWDFLYDLSGHEITMISGTGVWDRGEVYVGGRRVATYNNGTTYFVHTDWLATDRVRSTISGSVYQACNNLPFGDNFSCPGSDASPVHFTGKSHVYESGLDDFGARYDSSTMGRFMSADPIFIEAHRLGDPQQLNLYSYVRNNPLNLTDSTGALIDVNCSQVTAAQCSQTVTDLNNRQGAQFQVTRDDKTGQLNVVGSVDPSKLSDSERALYNAVTNASATGTLNVVAKDPSFDFEKYDKPGQNSLDRSDLNVLGTRGEPGDRRDVFSLLIFFTRRPTVSNKLAPAQPLEILPLPPAPFECQLSNPEIY